MVIHCCEKKSFFIKPIVSDHLSIYQSDGETDEKFTKFSTDEISAKILCYEYGSDFVYMPLLHTLDIFSN